MTIESADAFSRVAGQEIRDPSDEARIISMCYGIDRDLVEEHLDLFKSEILRQLWRSGDEERRLALQSLSAGKRGLLDHPQAIPLIESGLLSPDLFEGINETNQRIFREDVVFQLFGISEKSESRSVVSLDYGDPRYNFVRGHESISLGYCFDKYNPLSGADRKHILEKLLSATEGQLENFLRPVAQGYSIYPAMDLVLHGTPIDRVLEMPSEEIHKNYVNSGRRIQILPEPIIK